ncbi:MAG: hypothetical protein JJ850_12415 [Kordiimonadaceae bacterium]|nr:hypothetical protein [Kordiimonadaceae bacterium]MBO6568605.1 hypothetical protein [Kordiimonadaceae bacterium]MBO6965419.1 hypothetical protein [Kordiimonadaceae bacterium]
MIRVGTVFALCFLCAGMAAAQVAEDADPEFRDVQQARAALQQEDTELNRTMLAMALLTHGNDFYRQFKVSGISEDLKQALRHVEEASVLAPEAAPVWQLASSIYYDQRHVPEFALEALNAFVMLEKFASDDLSGRVLHIDFLMEREDWLGSLRVAERTFMAAPDFAIATLLDRMVFAYLRAGKPWQGIHFFRPYMDLHPAVQLSTAILFRRVGDDETAQSLMDQIRFDSRATPELRQTLRQLEAHWTEAGVIDD